LDNRREGIKFQRKHFERSDGNRMTRGINKKRTTWLLIAFFMVFVFAPVNYAVAEPIDDIVTQMQEIYGYMDDYDKGNIDAARTALQNFAVTATEDDWDLVFGVGTANELLTPEVIAKFQTEANTDEEAAAAARAAAKDILSGLGEIYYSTDAAGLRTTLENFKNDYKVEFQLLFGDDITMDEFYSLFLDARAALPGVIDTTEAGQLANDTNEALIAAMPGYLNEAMDQALLENPTFSGRLADIGWSTDKLIAQQEVLAGYIDQDGDARLSLALAVIRSETERVSGATTLQVGEKPEYTINIMGRNATSLLAWASAAPTIVQVSNDALTGNFVIEAISPGTTQLVVYRDYAGADPNHDWLLKFDVTVEGDAVLYGDVNDDGIITSSDHQRLFEHLNGTNLLTGDALIASDVNKDNKTDSSDHQRLFEHLNGTYPLS